MVKKFDATKSRAEPCDELVVTAHDGDAVARLNYIGEQSFSQIAAGDNRQTMALQTRQEREYPAVAEA